MVLTHILIVLFVFQADIFMETDLHWNLQTHSKTYRQAGGTLKVDGTTEWRNGRRNSI